MSHLQSQWQVPVVESDHRHDAVGNQLVDQAVVEGNTTLIHLHTSKQSTGTPAW